MWNLVSTLYAMSLQETKCLFPIDVQLTKDMVPVIYHDWTVTETGFDIPLNAITVEQFLNLRPSGHIKEYHTGVSDGPHGLLFPTINNTQPEPVYPVTNGNGSNAALTPTGARMGRSNSLGAIGGVQMYGRNVASKRLELTRTNKLGKVKGNGPESIQAPFTTLVEALKVCERKDVLFSSSDLINDTM